MTRMKRDGFTVVELLIVIVVIAVLAAITTVGYRGIQQRASISTMSSDLQKAAKAFELYKVDNDSYPTTMPAGTVTSANIILSATSTSSTNYCINAYHQNDATLRVSYDSRNGLQNGVLCSGATVGTSAGGTIPIAKRGINIVPDFSHWTLTGTATYNPTSGELTLGTNGTAKSPLIRIDSPAQNRPGADFYASVASAYSSFAPQGGYHIGTQYFASDGTTAVQNVNGHTGNGCAYAMPLNAWNNRACTFSAGPGTIYMTVLLYGSQGLYSSSDLRIRSPFLTIND